MQKSLRYIAALDGIRGIAISLVLLHHLPAVIGRDLDLLQPLSQAGWLGVDIFFVLSGFLITSILLSTAGRPFYFRNFYVRRGLRILPLYYTLLILIFVSRTLILGTENGMEPSPLWFFGFLSNFWYASMPASTDLILEVTWSLSVEEQFYLFWPLLVYWMPRRALCLLLISAIIAAPVFRLVLAQNLQTLCYPVCRMDALAAGSLTALWWSARDKRLPRHLGSAAVLMWIGLLTAVWFGAYREDGWGVPTIEYAFVPAVAVVTIAAVVNGRASLLSRMLGWRPLVWVGRVSFGLYLLHPVCFSMVQNLAAALGWHGRASSNWAIDWLLAALAVSLSLLAAEMSYRHFERQFLKMKDQLAPNEPRTQTGGPDAARLQPTGTGV